MNTNETLINETITKCTQEYNIPESVFETLKHCINTNDEEGTQMMLFVITKSINILLQEKENINLAHIKTLKKQMNITNT